MVKRRQIKYEPQPELWQYFAGLIDREQARPLLSRPSASIVRDGTVKLKPSCLLPRR